ncbi:glucosamine-6-phosphate deaminase [Peptacetobacter hominis]|uniref:Glucosamine-6-phosphate deaminase n=1 Tax=Peptacetobacter hominis TaxID=2743610 RepID=A0A544QVW0_9FIRM|nr:glucosamine-6-phosphate deaminase [Peptacetobacter hominis]TQQ84830.1 glucosamine-6-phosphate deaminase [Peptacetobacter hominis]
MKILVCKNYDEMSERAARIFAAQLILKPDTVLGLATGSTPEGMYASLVEKYNEGKIDFSEVTSFNLDEYYNLPKENDQSYDYFMKKHLFNHVNIKNYNLPNGMAEDVEKECKDYEAKIDAAGGIDIQVLGIGQNGHIGFNEPASAFKKETHLVELTESTIEANSRFFESADEVPKKAVSMGTGTIMKSKKIVLLASGEAKADAIAKTVYGDIDPMVPASILQLHKDVVLVLDEKAASKLDPKDYTRM